MDQSRDSILILTPGFPADEQDTACLPAVQNYVRAYAAARLSRTVHVVALQYPFVRRRYRWHGVTVHAVGGRNRRGLHRAAAWIRLMGAALRVMRRSNVEMLHSFWLGECTLLGARLCRLFHVPHVASIAGQDARAENRYLSRLHFDRMTITAGSAFAAQVFEASTGRKADAVIPLGLDDAFLRAAPAPEERDIDVLGVGSLIQLKRYDVFLELAARLVPDRPSLKAVIVGDGPERRSLQRRIERQGLEEHVRLAGPKTREEVARYILRSRVLLHPSEYEGQGYVFLEALAGGLYVLCRNVGFVGGHPAAYRCASDDELFVRLQDVLHGGPPPRGHVWSMDETVRRYDALYARLASGHTAARARQ